jgi:hypothetical protein
MVHCHFLRHENLGRGGTFLLTDSATYATLHTTASTYYPLCHPQLYEWLISLLYLLWFPPLIEPIAPFTVPVTTPTAKPTPLCCCKPHSVCCCILSQVAVGTAPKPMP